MEILLNKGQIVEVLRTHFTNLISESGVLYYDKQIIEQKNFNSLDDLFFNSSLVSFDFDTDDKNDKTLEDFLKRITFVASANINDACSYSFDQKSLSEALDFVLPHDGYDFNGFDTLSDSNNNFVGINVKVKENDYRKVKKQVK